ncbi:MAG TPA: AAA family ATPase [Rubrivivax sp.]|nr:AAA family ATPase [Rubrivivax sp.]
MSAGEAARQAALIDAWQQRLEAAAGPVRRIETHASVLLIAGGMAYKLKKALDLGFLDFRTLERRRHFCSEELRLNRRSAPELYLDVQPLTGDPAAPDLGGSGPVLEWVLRMRAFDNDGLWDRLAARGALRPEMVDALAGELVALHRGAAVAAADDPAGQPAAIRALLLDSLELLDRLCSGAAQRRQLQVLRAWEAGTFAALEPVFAERLRGGHVRECHGDLHLGNVTEVEGRTRLFDALEFDRALRFTDVTSDVAFLAMDLRAQALPRLAHRFVDACLAGSGDYDGLRVLRWYAVHRALVRAKVAALRADQLAGTDAAAAAAAAELADRYLDAALAEIRPGPKLLLLTHGLPGSGKTLLTQSLLELLGAVRLRADVERKRLFGLAPLDRADPGLRDRLYGDAANAATLDRLCDGAALALRAGWPVILDATFIRRAVRERVLALAGSLGARPLILDFRAPDALLRERVLARAARADDASDAGAAELALLQAAAEPLTAAELAVCEPVDAALPYDEAAMPARWAPLLRRLGLGAG